MHFMHYTGMLKVTDIRNYHGNSDINVTANETRYFLFVLHFSFCLFK